MFRILLINQPVANRGDESAHRGFVRALLQELPEVELTCLFVGESCADNIEQFKVVDERVKYVNLPNGGTSRKLSKLGLWWPLRWLWAVSPGIRHILYYYKRADWVVCAPGGADLGGFLSWKHLTYLCMARYCHKPLAYFGRSFGPLRDGGVARWFFKRQSLSIMRYMRFISLRDVKSQHFADAFQLPYTPTVDSAFLEQPQVAIPAEVSTAIEGKNYIVYVPNVLVWHYNFAGRISREVIRDFYVRLTKQLLSTFPSHQMLMLPQTFNGTREQNDINFFRELKQEVGDERMQVLSDQYSSDIQQQIIRGASLLVGARYHSVVFSLNNAIPFVGLSYEHKISGLLTSLGKEDCMVDLIEGLNTPESVEQTLRQIEEKVRSAKGDAPCRERAHSIALGAMRQFLRQL